VRPVAQAALRIKEASKLGFTSAIMPQTTGKQVLSSKDFATFEIEELAELAARIAGSHHNREERSEEY